MVNNVDDVFDTLKKTFEKQDELREKIRDLREKADEVLHSAQRTASAFHNASNVREVCPSVRTELSKLGEPIAAIEAVLPSQSSDGSSTKMDSFYRYSDLWSHQRQSVCALAVLLEFLENDRLPDVSTIKKLAGADIVLPLEDFLIGVCNAISDMGRLCMNRVIHNDYDTPARCAIFASHVFDAFKELNFRNDFLRKRFDGLKYDIKRLEEIVYDLSVRGLLSLPKPVEQNQTSDAGMDTA